MIDITPIINVILDLVMFGIGLDFVWCGYWYLKTKETTRLPKLLGFLCLKIFEVGNKKNRSKNELAKNMFSMKAAGMYLLVSGFQLMLGGAFKLFGKFP